VDIGKFLIIGGILIVVVGLLVTAGFRGLPGDIVIKRDNFTFIFPVVSMIVLSLILTLIMYLFRGK
jgi:hypothetical protein